MVLQERIVFLNGPIDDTVSNSVKAQLLYLESEAAEKPINLYIDTPGGSVNAGLSVYDTMTVSDFCCLEMPNRTIWRPECLQREHLLMSDYVQYISCPVTTTCIGQAASMGSLLLCGVLRRRGFACPMRVS